MTTDSPEHELPKISVVIPVLNEERHIRDCLESVQAQDYPPELVEIVVADGGSNDHTRELVTAAAARDPRIRLIDNPGRNQAAGLNECIRASSGELIARIDGHAAWRTWHLSRCVEVLHRTAADNVGGAMEAHGSTSLGKAVALATRTRLGAGGADYRVATVERDVETVYLGCFRRAVFDHIGLFNEALPPHEDFELNHRLLKAGGRIVFSPEIPTRYAPRENWKGLAVQYYRYGRGKVRAATYQPGVIKRHHLLPPALAIATAIGIPVAVSGRGRRFARRLMALYAAAVVGQSMLVWQDASCGVRIRLPLVFPVLHLSWGAGFWAGLIEALSRRRVHGRSC